MHEKHQWINFVFQSTFILMKISNQTQSLLLITLACVGLLSGRWLYNGETLGFGFIWNIFLAWLPLFFALLGRRLFQINREYFAIIAFLFWMLFFPNAPYIITDLIHLEHLPQHLWWYDTASIFLAAFLGISLGVYSLYIVHQSISINYNKYLGWSVVLGAAILSGFGVYLGRFVRLNSWDLLTQPANIIKHISTAVAEPLALKFTLLFALMLMFLYLALYNLKLPTDESL